uniref:TgrB1 n=2 Tax=Dictyostelium discoideum TaxID=44689 RepID=C0JMJ4_DICDI|nr:tgrB1 [Dictyostelium discoideum]ACN71256.1 tgrB1 [Dictyostelium discoideum]
MKVIYVLILLVCKFLFVKSSCYFQGKNLQCSKEFEKIELYNGTEVNVKMDTVGGNFYFNVVNFPYKSLLCDLNYKTQFTPEIESFPNIPTTGGEFGFTFNFPCKYLGDIKVIKMNDASLDVRFDTSKNQFVVRFAPQCGALILYNEENMIFNTTFETGAISNVPILDDDKGILTIQGSNLYNTSIKIYSTNIVKDTNPSGALDASHSSVTFSVEEFFTPNNWIIEVSICGSFYKNYSFPYLPMLIKMEGVLNDNGGNMVFTGNHLRPKHNVTGTFGNKTIECFKTNSSKSITCTIPSRKNYGSLGYDIPVTITIDGEYKSNTIKISYDLPLIQSVSQRGNSQIFDVTGVYFSGVKNMTVITGKNLKTDITLKKTATLEEPGFFIESNNTIFIFLPNNTQPGFMNLVVGDGGSETFTSPRYNFKITPTIAAGQTFNSTTSGKILEIKGIFMRTVDSDGRDVPLTVNSGSGGLVCNSLKDGDGLSFTCVLGPGFGSSHTMNVYYNLKPIGSFAVSYNPPYLSTIEQEKDGTIKIIGKDLGESVKDSIITVIYSDGNTVNGTVIEGRHDSLTFKYPVGNRNNASYIFQLGDQKSNKAGPFTLKPIIENTDPAVPCGGGVVTINGHYFFKYTKDTTAITIGKVPCNISSINETTIECVIVPNLRSLSPYYTSGTKPLVISSSNPGTEKVYQLTPAGLNYKFAPPTITNTSAIDQTALITIYGTSFGDANLEILINDKPCTQPEINIHTYSSLTCNVTNYDEMKIYNYSNTKFNISISVDGQYFIADIFQFKYESGIIYSENKSTGFPNEMYLGFVVFVIFIALISFAAKNQIEKYFEERKSRKAFRSLDNLRLKLRQKHATEIAKHYTFGEQSAPKPDKSTFYDIRKKLSRLPLIRRCFKEHTD